MKAAVWVLCLMWAFSAFAVLYLWQDDKGVFQLSDNLSQVPKEYQNLLGEKPEDKKEAGGVGYWRDARGNIHFYQAVQPVIAKPGAQPAGPKPGYDPLLDNSWKGKPNPEVWTKRVQKILGPDEILLDGGEILTYSGIAFPEQLKKDGALGKEAMEYQKVLLEGKTIKILFDQQKQDEKGRLLGQVFIGHDLFINADLVLKGYCQRKTVAPNLEYLSLYQRLEEHARKNKLGIWKELTAEKSGKND